jgi:type VI secretion system secreted protein VgrG
MVEYKSNQSFYQLHFSELDEEAVKVLSFEGEENISRLFEYRIELVSNSPELDAKSILNKKATFFLTRGGEEPVKLHGIISHFEQRGRTPEYVFYYAVLVPKMWRLQLNFSINVFQ